MFDIPPPSDRKPQQTTPLGQVEGPQAKLQRLLASQQKIKESKGKPISFSQPILWQKDNPVFFPKTINVIQGKAGVHKSRLAETECAALLKTPDSNRDLFNFKTNILTRMPYVMYTPSVTSPISCRIPCSKFN